MEQETTPREVARSIRAIHNAVRLRQISDMMRRKAMQQIHRPGR